MDAGGLKGGSGGERPSEGWCMDAGGWKGGSGEERLSEVWCMESGGSKGDLGGMPPLRCGVWMQGG